MRGASRHRSTGKPGKFTHVIGTKSESRPPVMVYCIAYARVHTYYRCGLISFFLSQVIPGPSSRRMLKGPHRCVLKPKQHKTTNTN